MQHDSANDGLTLTTKVGSVCQGWARWMSARPQARVRARGRQHVGALSDESRREHAAFCTDV